MSTGRNGLDPMSVELSGPRDARRSDGQDGSELGRIGEQVGAVLREAPADIAAEEAAVAEFRAARTTYGTAPRMRRRDDWRPRTSMRRWLRGGAVALVTSALLGGVAVASIRTAHTQAHTAGPAPHRRPRTTPQSQHEPAAERAFLAAHHQARAAVDRAHSASRTGEERPGALPRPPAREEARPRHDRAGLATPCPCRRRGAASTRVLCRRAAEARQGPRGAAEDASSRATAREAGFRSPTFPGGQRSPAPREGPVEGQGPAEAVASAPRLQPWAAAGTEGDLPLLSLSRRRVYGAGIRSQGFRYLNNERVGPVDPRVHEYARRTAAPDPALSVQFVPRNRGSAHVKHHPCQRSWGG